LNGRSIEFIQASVGEESSPARPFQTETAGVLVVPQVTIAELLDRFGIERLDVLHCDAQGAELGVIHSSLELLQSGRIGFVILSTHAEAVSGNALMHQACLDLLEKAGAKIIAEYDVHESFSGDGLIAACFAAERADLLPVSLSRNRYSTSLF